MDISPSISTSKRGALDVLVVSNSLGKAEIALFGAHILSFIPSKDNRERLWLSSDANFQGEKPIRGGIPLCWPWFGNDNQFDDDSLPSHGFLRTQTWTLQSHSGDDKKTTLTLVPETTQFKQFNADVEVKLIVVVSDTLKVSLKTTNTSTQAVIFNGALHTYFSFEDITSAEISGITGNYKDKLDNWASKTTPVPYKIIEETDRIHLCTSSVTHIKNTTITSGIQHSGHDSIVVWNPWKETSLSMADMNNEGFNNMVCVETALTQWKELQPEESHTLEQVIS
ncbi:D-hexose-6-phosphate mutarotase [Alteromonas sp. 5E99-2]|uniref:D-hexose-6-phosphate mutarotase n=1 Tax=Alteromonas sp. 5E99-2 TaxID=2817683 RepID=UPI001A99012D|nr:D-hexose-6-phosphate mutarotase [Alteromonas sp. 5E99-2]MBO1256219.1 D-hexose-6-phosphate mutarotase [Alteromonas sp. 5E99-2]